MAFWQMSSPAKTTNRYMLSKIKQLIELNGESVNYKINFRAISANKQPFEALVVTQTELDKNPSLEYQKVTEGMIEAQISNDNNVYQSYFLILKADQPCECEVEIVKEELPKVETFVPPSAPQQSNDHLLAVYPSKEGGGWGKTFLILFGVGAICLAIYWYYKSSKKQSVPVMPPTRNNFSFFRNNPKPAASPSPSASSNSSTKSENPILQGLKKLQPK